MEWEWWQVETTAREIEKKKSSFKKRSKRKHAQILSHESRFCSGDLSTEEQLLVVRKHNYIVWYFSVTHDTSAKNNQQLPVA